MHLRIIVYTADVRQVLLKSLINEQIRSKTWISYYTETCITVTKSSTSFHKKDLERFKQILLKSTPTNQTHV